MNVKKLIKDILPVCVLEYVSLLKKQMHGLYGKLKNNGICIVNNSMVDTVQELSLKKHHVYFGYYDLPQINKDGTKALAICLPHHARPGKNDAKIGFFTLPDGIFHSVANTSAWCWQQGSRLRWHPFNNEIIIFNAIVDGQPVTHLYNINTRSIQRTYEKALYDFSADMKYGISLNFFRLQKLRPGYGYNNSTSETLSNCCPKKDGLFLVDLTSGQSEMILSIFDVSALIPEANRYEHYFNHVSFAPSGQKFMVYHLYIDKSSGKRYVKVYVYYLNSRTYKEIPIKNPAHYCWKNDDELLFTYIDKNGIVKYLSWNVENGNNKCIGENILTGDGHPTTFHEEYLVSDTYPNKYQFQTAFIYDYKNNKKIPLIKLFHHPVRFHDMRCDLHPRVHFFEDVCKITIDTTSSGHRKILILNSTKILELK